MSWTLLSIFTHDKNAEYFRIALRCALRSYLFARDTSKEYFDVAGSLGILIIDFSNPKSDVIYKVCQEDELFGATPYTKNCGLETRPGASYIDNMNYIMDVTRNEMKYNYLWSLNDDAFVNKNWFRNAYYLSETLKMFNDRKIAVLGGVPQVDGRWNDDIANFHFPQENDRQTTVRNYTRLWWEMSACLINMDLVRDIRFDPFFEQCFGLCSDNDFFIQLARQGMDVMRSEKLRFWHARGVSQSKAGRNPFLSRDPHKILASRYLRLKWGIDIADMQKETRLKDVYDEPFDGVSHQRLSSAIVDVGGLHYDLAHNLEL